MKDTVQVKNQSRGTTLVILSAVFFASYGVWSRLMGSYFPNFYQGYVRSLIIFVFLLPIIVWRKELVKIARGDIKWLCVYLLFTAATQAPIYYAFNHMDIGTATLLFYVSFLITMYVVGLVFLGEKLDRVKWISFIVACVGLYTVFSFSLGKFTLLAASMAVLNGVASGGEVAFSKKLSNTYSSLYLTAWSWGIIVVTSLPISLLLGERQVNPAFEVSWLYLLGYALVSLLGFWTVLVGVKFLQASIAGLLGLLEIIFSIVFGMVIFDERLTTRIVIGGMLILFAAALPNIAHLRHRQILV